MGALARINETAISTSLVESARTYMDASLAPKTRKLYGSAWKLFTAWCSDAGVSPLPATPESVALYITHRADIGRSVSTIRIDLAAIKLAHEVAEAEIPTDSKIVRTMMRGIRRTIGTAPTQKAPVSLPDLRRMVATLDLATVRGVRDHAVLVMGFASAMRRSELAALDLGDITFTDDGIRLVIRRSKSDQESAGRTIGIPWGSHPATCPVRVLRAWLDLAGITAGPLFRTVDRAGRLLDRRMSPRAVARAVKRVGTAVGLDACKLGGHSLRAGFATEAARAGASERSIARQTGHRSMAVLRGYIRDGTLFSDNAAALVGL